MPTRHRLLVGVCLAGAAAAIVARKMYLSGNVNVDIRKSKQPNLRTAAVFAKFLQTHSIQFGYNDSLLLRFGGAFQGSVQTIGHYFARKLHAGKSEEVRYNRELFVLSDGGTIALDWCTTNTNSVDRPLVLLHHGLCGSSDSVYIKHMIAKFQDLGYDSVVFVARGCGGLELTTQDGFTASRTQDMREAICEVQARFPANRAVFAVGFSLGAGLLLKYLGEEAENCSLAGAVAISPAFDFSKTPQHFNLWSEYRLVHGLIEWAKGHAHVLSKHPEIEWNAALQAKNVREFDSACVVGPYKYRDVDHYYADSSPVNVSARISIPCLSVSALDDPVCCGMSVPMDGHDNLGPGLVAIVTENGGHVAFAEGLWPSTSWMDRIAADWFESSL